MIDSDLETTIPLFERFLRMNCEMLLTCLHECEHCIQNIQMNENNDDTLEKKLIRVEDNYLSKAEGLFVFYDDIDKVINEMRIKYMNLEQEYKDMKDNLEKVNKYNDKYENKITNLGEDLNEIQNKYNDLSNQYMILSDNYNKLLSEKSKINQEEIMEIKKNSNNYMIITKRVKQKKKC